MKTKFFTLLLAIVAGTNAIFAWTYEKKVIGGICYNLEENGRTAQITYPDTEDRYTDLTSVYIPKSVTYSGVTYDVTTIVQDNPFGVSYKLSAFNVESSNEYFCAINGVLFSKDQKTLIIYPRAKTDTEYIMPNSVTNIGRCAFASPANLKKVTLSNNLKKISYMAFSSCMELTDVVINNGVTTLETGAFYNCYKLNNLVLPSSVTKIDAYGLSFYGYLLESVRLTCEAVNPPQCTNDAFLGTSDRLVVYVPANSVKTYNNANGWKNFTIKPIKAATTGSATPKAKATHCSVVVEWVSVEGADSYIVDITNDENVAFCSLNFDEEGQLLTNSYSLPSRNGYPREVQNALQTANGWQYTINGLNPATKYIYIITAKQGSSVLFTQSVEFHTNSLEPINNIQTDKAQSTKLLHNGQVFILRGDKVYTTTGQELK